MWQMINANLNTIEKNPAIAIAASKAMKPLLDKIEKHENQRK